MTSQSGLKQAIAQFTGHMVRQGTTAILVTAVVLLVGWSGLQWFQVKLTPTSVTTTEVRTLIMNELQGMTELTTARMSTKATVVVSQDRRIGEFFLGDTHLVYEGVGDIHAGIDLMGLEAKQVDMAQGRIELRLPPPEITNVALNVNRSSVLANYKRFFGPDAELELQEQAQREALRQMRAEACTANLLETTNQNAKQVVEQILKTAGYREIIIQTQPPRPGTCSIT